MPPKTIILRATTQSRGVTSDNYAQAFTKLKMPSIPMSSKQPVGSKSSFFSRPIPKSKDVDVAKIIKEVASKLRQISTEIKTTVAANPGVAAAENERLIDYKGPPAIQNYVSIFKEEERLRKLLTQEAKEPEAIFITGTHGIGKSMLAATMYDYHKEEQHQQFSKFIWVCVPNPTARNIFLAVLGQLKQLGDNGHQKNEWQLSELVTSCLKGQRFLIVLDNVSELERDDWNTLISALSKGDKNSKILVTTNNEQLSRTSRDSTIKLDKLSDGDSWEFLKKLIFWDDKRNLGLETEGKMIAFNCHGLPHAIGHAAYILTRKDSNDYELEERKKIWHDVSLEVITYALPSYDTLEYHLRVCFLYMGIFPENITFSASKLFLMWIAEGLVRPTGDKSLMETANEYLRSLADRNLVTIEEKRPDGTAKTCIMNSLSYNFCTTESGIEKENFFQQFKKRRNENEFDPSIDEVDKNRRICVHSDISIFIKKFIISSARDSAKMSLRSFVSHDKAGSVTMHKKDISKIGGAFKLLRVLDAKPMAFNKIHDRFCDLVHLRYITLTLNGNVLPAAISKLRYIETLIIVHTGVAALEVKADILNMDKLRHFKTNVPATLLKKSKASDESDKQLQSLCGVSPQSCTQKFFDKTPNLVTLVIRGDLSPLLNQKSNLFETLREVEKLKLLNDATCPTYQGNLCHLPQFPPKMKRLTLTATSLDIAQISVLGSLQTLKELKLYDNAFVGDEWELGAEDFINLTSLHIRRLNFKGWKYSNPSPFPHLSRLVLSECDELEKIPFELAAYSTFKLLHLSNCKVAAAASARKIYDEKVKLMKRTTEKKVVFNFRSS